MQNPTEFLQGSAEDEKGLACGNRYQPKRAHGDAIHMKKNINFTLNSQLTRYADLMNQHDFYETAARKETNPLKEKIFKALAREYKDKALALTIAEAQR